MNIEKKLDRRRKYFLILDTETATLPYAQNFEGAKKQRISIAKPLIYDFGWQIVDYKGNVYRKRSFLISEIFSVPSVFNTAYYAEKRPLYLEKLSKGEIILKDWKSATEIFENDLKEVFAVGAFNSMFDYKKAISFTEEYINALYSPNFYEWEKKQNAICDYIASGKIKESRKDFNPNIFSFRNSDYLLFDLWGLSCKYILNCEEYRKKCICNGWLTGSKKYYKTSAETTYRFIKNCDEFIEVHMAIEDAEIESEIFAHIAKKCKNKIEMGIFYFPFKMVGQISEL